MATSSKQQSLDYERIAKAIAFIRERSREQPSLDKIAEHIHLSPFHCQRLFKRWAGLSPKQFLQVVTLEHAKQRLQKSPSLTDLSQDVGLSGSSRLHDHFVTIEAMTPGEVKQQGKHLVIKYGEFPSAFGQVFFATTKRGLCQLEFVANNQAEASLSRLKNQWQFASFTKGSEAEINQVQRLLGQHLRSEQPIKLHVTGTNFQIGVWKALLKVAEGSVVSYAEVAKAVGKPNAVRAVGTAVGANPIACLIPCHRVLRQNGGLGGYRWGLDRKQAMLIKELGAPDDMAHQLGMNPE